MKSRERFVLPSSEYYNFSPSALSREYLLHVLCVGDFCYAPDSVQSRKRLPPAEEGKEEHADHSAGENS